MTEAEQKAVQDTGISALQRWDEDHAADIAYAGGPLGPTKRTSDAGIADVVNEHTVFMVVRPPRTKRPRNCSRATPNVTIFPCDSVDVMPLLGP